MELIENAKNELAKAYAEAQQGNNHDCSYKDFVDSIIDNTHLTYKYVLFTELLAKATDPSINPLCLQKKSKLSGSYDARTLCHKVVVKFEMETLNKVLGGSNEPFLNKPARFAELSKTNAVRRGNDQRLLNSLCDTLPSINQEDAHSALVYLLYKLINLRNQQQTILSFTVEETANLPSHLMSFIEKAVDKSYEGETLTLMIAGAYHLIYNMPNAVVEVHPVNEAGSSSKEISDLDIYVDGKLISSNELKDKIYAETDVRHAADKVIVAGGTKMLFIEGPHSHPNANFKTTIEAEYQQRNFLLRILSYESFLSSILGSTDCIDAEEFMKFILEKAHDTKFKNEVIKYIDDLAQTDLKLQRIK